MQGADLLHIRNYRVVLYIYIWTINSCGKRIKSLSVNNWCEKGENCDYTRKQRVFTVDDLKRICLHVCYQKSEICVNTGDRLSKAQKVQIECLVHMGNFLWYDLILYCIQSCLAFRRICQTVVVTDLYIVCRLILYKKKPLNIPGRTVTFIDIVCIQRSINVHNVLSLLYWQMGQLGVFICVCMQECLGFKVQGNGISLRISLLCATIFLTDAATG